MLHRGPFAALRKCYDHVAQAISARANAGENAAMIKLYDSAFSPFARKVRMVLDYKSLSYDAVDGLLKSNHAALKAVNGRIEVPVLVDGDIVVVNSPDIVAYLDERYPANPVCPQSPAARVHARAWERTADTLVDPIFVDISYWNGQSGRTRCRKVCSTRRVPTCGWFTTRSTMNWRNGSSSADPCRLPIWRCSRISPAPERWRSSFQQPRIQT
jgi:hypothetical protein